MYVIECKYLKLNLSVATRDKILENVIYLNNSIVYCLAEVKINLSVQYEVPCEKQVYDVK